MSVALEVKAPRHKVAPVSDRLATESPAGPAVPRVVAIVPHTHWDREWYLPFQAFRLRLVELLDDFLPRLESDPSYDRFLLDGQMAVVDDYLEMRPGAEPALQALAAAGRLAVGPWYILMDEFLVSGETIVRNLQLGLARAQAFGGAMPVGYLPDMFGHVAQMPQLLRQAGFEHAVVWRGVPSAVDRSAFWWQAPDGSTVRAEYLLVGYGNGAALPTDAGALVRRVAAHARETAGFSTGPGAPILWMNGTDHQTPQPWLGQVVADANARQDQFHLTVSSLPEYLAKAPTSGLPSWQGELRSGARANLLMGVGSNRVDIKIAAARAERALERQAEPLSALWLGPGRWPGPELALAWGHVIRNSAHDSICACSHDQVGDAVLHRYAEATTIADGLRRRALWAAGAAMAHSGPVIVNPSARPLSGVVEVTVAGNQPVEGTQVISQVAAGEMEVAGTGADIGALLGELAGAGFPVDRSLRSVALDVDESGVELSINLRHRGALDLGAEAVMAEAWAQAGAHRDQPLRVRVTREGWQQLAVYAGVPGFGWAAWGPGPLPVAPVTVTIPGAAPGATLANGVIEVAVGSSDGTWSLGRPGSKLLAGLDRLVDDGDAGDTYNYSPPDRDVVVDQPAGVSVAAIETGPLRGRLRICREFLWPEQVAGNRRSGNRRSGERRVEVVTDLELRAGEDLVRVTTTFDNQCRDHRLRAWFPLPSTSSSSRAECAFGIVERGLVAEGGPHEYPLPTFPSRRFVSAGGLTIVHEGLLEYELVEGGSVLALTLLRATGILSQPTMAFRPNAAGPAHPLEGPQMQGPVTVRYAVHYGERDPYQLADQAWLPLEVTHGGGIGSAGPRGSRLTVTGAEVSALQRVEDRIEVRVFNPSPAETIVTLDGRAGWLVDLRGGRLERFEQSFRLRPWGMATVQLDGPE